MMNSNKVSPLKNFRKVLNNIITAIKDFINFDDNNDNSNNKAQYLAQRTDGKQVAINRKF